MELLTHRLSGLETMIELTFLVATLDSNDVYARAATNLIGVVRRHGGPKVGATDEWMKGTTMLVEQALADGDILADRDHGDLAQVLVSHSVGVRHVNDVDDTVIFMARIKKQLVLDSPGIRQPRPARLLRAVRRTPGHCRRPQHRKEPMTPLLRVDCASMGMYRT